MKKLIFVVLFLMPAICFAQPSLNFRDQSYDAGSVSQGDVVRHFFEFTNSGDQDLVIQKVAASWGCTAAMASSANLKPGEEGKIDVSVDTRGKTGIVSKTVQVVSNDPKQPTTTLFIRMTIKTSEQPVRQP